MKHSTITTTIYRTLAGDELEKEPYKLVGKRIKEGDEIELSSGTYSVVGVAFMRGVHYVTVIRV